MKLIKIWTKCANTGVIRGKEDPNHDIYFAPKYKLLFDVNLDIDGKPEKSMRKLKETDIAVFFEGKEEVELKDLLKGKPKAVCKKKVVKKKTSKKR